MPVLCGTSKEKNSCVSLLPTRITKRSLKSRMMDWGGFWPALLMPLVIYGGVSAISGTQKNGRIVFYVVAALINVILLSVFFEMLSDEKNKTATLMAIFGLAISNAIGFLIFKNDK